MRHFVCGNDGHILTEDDGEAKEEEEEEEEEKEDKRRYTGQGLL